MNNELELEKRIARLEGIIESKNELIDLLKELLLETSKKQSNPFDLDTPINNKPFTAWPQITDVKFKWIWDQDSIQSFSMPSIGTQLKTHNYFSDTLDSTPITEV